MPTGRGKAWTRCSIFPDELAACRYRAGRNASGAHQKLDRIVALDEFDMETAATLREHLRMPGMGLTTMRYFRDKLAMRMRALDRRRARAGFCSGHQS